MGVGVGREREKPRLANSDLILGVDYVRYNNSTFQPAIPLPRARIEGAKEKGRHEGNF